MPAAAGRRRGPPDVASGPLTFLPSLGRAFGGVTGTRLGRPPQASLSDMLSVSYACSSSDPNEGRSSLSGPGAGADAPGIPASGPLWLLGDCVRSRRLWPGAGEPCCGGHPRPVGPGPAVPSPPAARGPKMPRPNVVAEGSSTLAAPTEPGSRGPLATCGAPGASRVGVGAPVDRTYSGFALPGPGALAPSASGGSGVPWARSDAATADAPGAKGLGTPPGWVRRLITAHALGSGPARAPKTGWGAADGSPAVTSVCWGSGAAPSLDPGGGSVCGPPWPVAAKPLGCADARGGGMASRGGKGT